MDIALWISLSMLTPQASFYTFTPSVTVGADTVCRAYHRVMYRLPDASCEQPPCLEPSSPLPVACTIVGGEAYVERGEVGEVVAACLYSAKDNHRGDCVTQESFR